jgi:tetratricopeptide (TPR) repeat protein
LLESEGNYTEARPLRERVLTVYEQMLGSAHPWTATALNNLGALLDSQGELAAARPYYERALDIREQVLGPQHPDTMLTLANLKQLDLLMSVQHQGVDVSSVGDLDRQLMGMLTGEQQFKLQQIAINFMSGGKITAEDMALIQSIAPQLMSLLDPTLMQTLTATFMNMQEQPPPDAGQAGDEPPTDPPPGGDPTE